MRSDSARTAGLSTSVVAPGWHLDQSSPSAVVVQGDEHFAVIALLEG